MEFQKEYTTVWSFPERGKWATHSGKYRGNFAPQIARNIILRYSQEGDVVLDPMVGSGTTLIEAQLLNRKSIGIDINPKAVELSRKNIDFECKYKAEVFIGDARDLSEIEKETIDLILTHPPYLNIIKYSDGEIDGDLSRIGSVKKFIENIRIIAKELFRVLKKGKYCALLIGDTRKFRHYVPLSYLVMKAFLDEGFLLKEDIIKIQHNCTTTPYWKKQVDKYNFYLIMHEHLFVFRKPENKEDYKKHKNSSAWIYDTGGSG